MRLLQRHPRAALVLVIGVAVAALAALLVVNLSPGSPPSRFVPGQTQNQACGGAVAPKGRLPWVRRDGSKLTLDGRTWRFSGVNEYWLGLQNYDSDGSGPEYPSHEAIRQGISAAAQLCARTVRAISLGVDVGSPRSLEPTLDHFNPRAFDSIDYAVAQARSHGIRLVIPLSDAYHYYSGGIHTFTNWLGFPDIPGQRASTDQTQQYRENQFFSDRRVIEAFRRYVHEILDHVNKYTGVRLGSDPTVAVWELGNELKAPPTTWVQQTATYVKSLAPDALVGFSGSVAGGDLTQAAAAAPAVDVYDGHFYPPDLPSAMNTAATVTAANRVYIAGEYPIYVHDLPEWYSGIEQDRQISGDLAWSLLPTVNGNPVPHDDGYTFHVPPASDRERSFVPILARHARAMITGT